MSGGFNLVSAIHYINDCNRKGGYIVSYDDVKAFDRASVRYCDLVMTAMDFPPQFRAWVRMLHSGANTQLLAGSSGLTRSIQVTFSLRQGDGLSMPLYCIQREPFLRRIATLLTGLRIGRNPVVSYQEIDEDFCDDTNIVSSDLDDITKFDVEMKKYEAQSGSMLSRSKKCKIFFLGSWRGRQEAPLPWLKVVEELRVFGLILTPEYKTTLSKTWQETFRGFQKTIFSWKQRNFDSMYQRVEAVRTFALSKLWYVSQILPLPPKFASKIESLTSSFLFKGKTERLELMELCLPPERGVLSLPEIRSRADALRLKHLCRMLEQRECGAYRHLCYWQASSLQMYTNVPEMMNLAPVYHGRLPAFFQHAEGLLLEGFLFFQVLPRELDMVTTKELYKSFTTDLPDTKITNKFVTINFPAVVWPRLAFTVLEPAVRQLVFDLVHSLVRNRVRLYQQGRVEDPWCHVCPEVAGQRPHQNTVHIFTSCCLVRQPWEYVKALVRTHQPGGELLTVEELVTFTFPAQHQDREVVWILANFFSMVWSECGLRGRELKVAGVRGMLQSRLRSVRLRKVGTILVQL